MNTRLGPYVLDGEVNEDALVAELARWQPPVITILNPSPGRVQRIHAACPGALLVLRNHPLSEQHDDMHADPEGTGVRHARELHDWRVQIAPDVPAGQVILPGINEPDANPGHYNGQGVQHIVRYTMFRFREHARLGDRGGGPDFAVTWPWYGHWEAYEDLHRVARETNCVITYHRYWRGDLGLDHEWEQWAGEWPPNSWSDTPQIIVETGDDGLLMNRQGGPSGWQDVLEPPEYLDQLTTFDSRLIAFPPILGACIFGYGKQSPWQSYDIAPIGPLLSDYAESLRMNNPPVPAQTLEQRLRAEFKTQFKDLRRVLFQHPTKRYETREVSNISRVILHHTTGNPSALSWESIARFHVVSRGWPGIAYHIGISPDGVVSYLGDIETIRYHAGEANADSLAVCCLGDYENSEPSEAMLDALERLLALLDYPVLGHSDVNDTVCPGRHLNEWLNVQAPPSPAEPLPENEPDGSASFLAEKVRWWTEQMARQRESGHAERADAILYSLIKPQGGLLYRLERKLKAA